MNMTIVNPYINELKDELSSSVDVTYVLLDKIMGVAVYTYTDQNVSVNKQTHSFMVVHDNLNVRVTPHIMTASVEVVVKIGEAMIARIEIGVDGPVEEIYAKMDRNLRDSIKQFFDRLSQIDINQDEEPSNEELTGNLDEGPEIHFGGDDNE
jgi:hypothetical protein